MSILQSFNRLGRFIRGGRIWRCDDAYCDLLKTRSCGFEQMEPRQLLSGTPPQIHFGSVFFELPRQHAQYYSNRVPGWRSNTQLTQLVIDGSKQQLGLAVGDTVWDARPVRLRARHP